MFLISAHQSYLKNKFLKKRLNTPTINRNQLDQTVYDESNTGNKYSYALSFLPYSSRAGSIIRGKFDIRNTDNWIGRALMSSREPQRRYIQPESKQVQRTKKYFSSDGHKFVFNNT